MAKTTKKDFELFKKECEKWIEIIGLKDWHIWYEHGGTDEGNIAEFITDSAGRACSIWFADEISGDKTDYDVKSTAFHEIIEIYMIDLRNMALESCSRERVDSATHRVVRMLENVLFPKY